MSSYPQMKMKINKACDLSSISVLPPQSRRRSSAPIGGSESSTIFGRSQTASQFRSQQPQQSQLSVSQGISSQHGLFSQFSQNSQDEILTNEKIESQERENSARRVSCLPPINYTREESQMLVSRTSSNPMRKWPGQEYKTGQISEELEHKIGMIETSLSRFGMVLDSVQSDVIQVNKGTKEVLLEMEGVRQKLMVHEDLLQSMNKGQEDIKTLLDTGFKSQCDQLKQTINQENLNFSMLSSLSDKVDSRILKLQDLHRDFSKDIQAYFSKEIQVLVCSMEISKLKQATPTISGHKAAICDAPPEKVHFSNTTTRQMKTRQASVAPKVEMGGWTSVKQERTISKGGNLSKKSHQITPSTQPERVIIESDEEFDGVFSCLRKDQETEKAEEETARILRKARRKKRKYCNTIIID